MGVLRKAAFIGTGGLSGLAGVKANSKKERAAKAAEKQLKLTKEAVRAQEARDKAAARVQAPAAAEPAPVLVADELTKLAALNAEGVLTEEEFAAQKAKLLSR